MSRSAPAHRPPSTIHANPSASFPAPSTLTAINSLVQMAREAGEKATNNKRKREAREGTADGESTTSASGETKKKVASTTLYTAVKTVFESKAKQLDAALSTLLEARREALSEFFVKPEGMMIEQSVNGEVGEVDRSSERVDVTLVTEEGRARVLLSDQEKDVALLRLDEMVTKIRHEDAMARLRKTALELVDASFL